MNYCLQQVKIIAIVTRCSFETKVIRGRFGTLYIDLRHLRYVLREDLSNGSYCISFVVLLTLKPCMTWSDYLVHSQWILITSYFTEPFYIVFNTQNEWTNQISSDAACCAVPPTSSEAYVLLIEIDVCLLSAVIFVLSDIQCVSVNITEQQMLLLLLQLQLLLSIANYF